MELIELKKENGQVCGNSIVLHRTLPFGFSVCEDYVLYIGNKICASFVLTDGEEVLTLFCDYTDKETFEKISVFCDDIAGFKVEDVDTMDGAIYCGVVQYIEEDIEDMSTYMDIPLDIEFDPDNPY